VNFKLDLGRLNHLANIIKGHFVVVWTDRQTHNELIALTGRQSGQQQNNKLEMWANAQRDGRPAEHRWRPLFNAAKFG